MRPDMAGLSLNSTINLAGAQVLLVESTHQGMGVLSQIFAGFGLRGSHRARDSASAMALISALPLDLIVSETALPDKDGYDFVRELRRLKGNPNCSAPVILITGHTQLSKVKKARDCGANFIIAKPLTPRVVLERVIWVSRDPRPFVSNDVYAGPDRRFEYLDMPAEEDRRVAQAAPAEAAIR